VKLKQKPKMPFSKILLITVLVAAITYGVLYYTILVPFEEESERKMKEFEESLTQEEPELTSTITPARDLSGKWIGLFESQENTPDVDCLYTSTFELQLQQKGNNLQGSMIFTNIDVEQNYKSSIPIPCGIKKLKMIVAMKPIKKGDEITIDYSTTVGENYWKMNCLCGSKNCRKIIGPYKFLTRKIKKKYKGWESDYLLKG